MTATHSVLEQMGPVGPGGRAGVQEILCLINGTWVPGAGEAHDINSPINGDTVATVRYATPAQIDEVIAGAKAAQKDWEAVPMAAKAKLLHKATDAVEARADSIIRALTAEMGKTLEEAHHEVMSSVTVPLLRGSIEDALRLNGSAAGSIMPEHPNRRILTTYDAIGVGVMLSPWNFPAEMIFNCVGAMMMGNTVVWKPSEFAPLSPYLVSEAFASVGLPPGVFNIVYGDGQIGEQLVSHKDVGLVGLIGSTPVGDRIARVAPMKRLMLELGGNGPLIVMDDADLDQAVEGAISGCFYMAGQVCVASERLLVHEAVFDAFLEKFIAAAAKIKVGNPFDPDTTMGPMVSERILAKTTEHLADATEHGAKIVFGGNREALYHEPTILVDVTPEMRIAREETFGPVAPIIKFSTQEEALELANDSDYGLQMAVFTRSLTTAWEMAEQLEAGVVVVNRGNMDWELNAPFGGVKQSGIGREASAWALKGFANVKQININLL